MCGSKRNQVKQPADIDTDVVSHRKTEMKEEGDTEQYKMKLSGRVELKTHTSES